MVGSADRCSTHPRSIMTIGQAHGSCHALPHGTEYKGGVSKYEQLDAGVQAPYTGFTRDTILYLVHEVPMSMAMAGNLDITKTKDRKYCTDLVSSKT